VCPLDRSQKLSQSVCLAWLLRQINRPIGRPGSSRLRARAGAGFDSALRCRQVGVIKQRLARWPPLGRAVWQGRAVLGPGATAASGMRRSGSAPSGQAQSIALMSRSQRILVAGDRLRSIQQC